MQIFAVSLIGIPASGKTTLSRKILESSRLGVLNASVIVVSFDDIIKIDYADLSNGDYKRSRELLLNHIENLLRKLREGDKDLEDDDELKVKRNLLRGLPALVVLDDNMYFRSMRQRIRAICRDVDCQHFQIFKKSSLEEAKLRNSQREVQVPEAVIEKMIAQLEPPQNTRTIIVETSMNEELVIELIKDRIKNPEKLEIQTESRQVQPQSLVHEADLITRKELNTRIQTLKASSDKDFSSTCAILNNRRKEFMDDLRSQKLAPPDVESLRTAFNCYLDK